jgi:hypothetical protein
MRAANPKVWPPLVVVNKEKSWNPALRESPTTTMFRRAEGPFAFGPNAKSGAVNNAPKATRQIADEGIHSLLNDI